jgi:hypothetical protein
VEYSKPMTLKSSLRLPFAVAAALVLSIAAAADPLASPTWGFSLDLPEGFELSGGDRKNRFSFYDAAAGASLDMVAYPAGRFASPEALLADAARRLLAEAEPAAFEYRGRKAAISRLAFTAPFGSAEGWALAVELEAAAGGEERRPLLLMLAYGKATETDDARYLSALDSLSPAPRDKTAAGPISVFAFPSKGTKEVQLTVGGERVAARIDESDAEAAKDRKSVV